VIGGPIGVFSLGAVPRSPRRFRRPWIIRQSGGLPPAGDMLFFFNRADSTPPFSRPARLPSFSNHLSQTVTGRGSCGSLHAASFFLLFSQLLELAHPPGLLPAGPPPVSPNNKWGFFLLGGLA